MTTCIVIQNISPVLRSKWESLTLHCQEIDCGIGINLFACWARWICRAYDSRTCLLVYCHTSTRHMLLLHSYIIYCNSIHLTFAMANLPNLERISTAAAVVLRFLVLIPNCWRVILPRLGTSPHWAIWQEIKWLECQLFLKLSAFSKGHYKEFWNCCWTFD